MKDKRTPMNAFRPKAQTALVVALSLFMAACSNNPLMRTSAATSSDVADEIDRTLEQLNRVSG